MRDTRGKLALYVVVGAAAGLVYSAINRLFDLTTGFGTLPSSLQPLHAFFDLVLPVFIGALLGLSMHYVRLRAALIEAEKKRGDDLRQRLAHTERDQAVWVLAAAVLHEVKNPLHALGLLIDDVAATDDPSERAKILEKARSHVSRIADRLAELRGLSGDGAPEIEPTPMNDLAREVAGAIAPIASKDSIELSVRADEGAVAACDASYARVILENLVENAVDAVRAGKKPGKVAIDVGKVNGHVHVRVTDDGPGLREGEREAIFQPLRSSKKGGLGLGLSISRKLARAMDGDVRYDDVEPRGFVLVLPREEPHAS